MTEQRFRKGDRVDFNNGYHRGFVEPNGTPGTIKRVIVKRVYVIDWDDDTDYDNNDTDPYRAEELIRLEGDAS